MRACAAHGTSIVPQGGNTGLVGGSVPDASGTQVLLSLTRLNRVREHRRRQPDDDGRGRLRAAGGAGGGGRRTACCSRSASAAEGSCTIGGNLATNAGGTQVLRYGNARELCLGLEVVTAAGEVWDGLTGLRKDNTGYDLRDLFIGSEGTLGIITAATLKLYPQPAARADGAGGAADARRRGRAAAARARARSAPALTGFEVMNAFSLDLVRKHFPQLRQPLPPAPWTVLLEQSDTEGEAHARGALEALLGDGARARPDRRRGDRREHRAVARDVAPARIDSARAGRGRPEHQARHRAAGLGDRRLRRRDRRRAASARFPACAWSTSATSATATCTTTCRRPQGADAPTFLRDHEHAVNTHRLRRGRRARRLDLGRARHRRAEARRAGARKSPVALAMMRAIKHALDPRGRAEPGARAVRRQPRR